MPHNKLSIAQNCKSFKQRKKPTDRAQRGILEDQDNRCFYCGLRFGEWYHDGKFARERSVRWDHLLPYSYSFNNNNDNFVAACQQCNGIKSARVFETLDEAAEFVRNRRLEKGLKNHVVWGNEETRHALAEKLFCENSTNILLCKPTANDSIEELENKLHSIRMMQKLLRKIS